MNNVELQQRQSLVLLGPSETSGSLRVLATIVFLAFVGAYAPRVAKAEAPNPRALLEQSLAAMGATVPSDVEAINYAATRPNFIGGVGLMYPNKSSVFRSVMAKSALLGRLAEAMPWVSLIAAEAQGLKAEVQAVNKGTCQPLF